jgi:hypothetical protein
MPKKKHKAAKIYVSHAFTKFQTYHFEKPSKCCGSGVAQSPDLFDMIEEFVFCFGVYDNYVYDLRHPHIKFGILWQNGKPSIRNLPAVAEEAAQEAKRENDMQQDNF